MKKAKLVRSKIKIKDRSKKYMLRNKMIIKIEQIGKAKKSISKSWFNWNKWDSQNKQNSPSNLNQKIILQYRIILLLQQIVT